MGFKTGAFCTIWEIEPTKSDKITRGRVSVSTKNKSTGKYDTSFSGYVSFVGADTAKEAARLERKDRIKLGDIDVTTAYTDDKKVNTRFTIFSFEKVAHGDSGAAPTYREDRNTVDSGELEPPDDNSQHLPF